MSTELMNKDAEKKLKSWMIILAEKNQQEENSMKDSIPAILFLKRKNMK